MGAEVTLWLLSLTLTFWEELLFIYFWSLLKVIQTRV